MPAALMRPTAEPRNGSDGYERDIVVYDSGTACMSTSNFTPSVSTVKCPLPRKRDG